MKTSKTRLDVADVFKIEHSFCVDFYAFRKHVSIPVFFGLPNCDVLEAEHLLNKTQFSLTDVASSEEFYFIFFLTSF